MTDEQIKLSYQLAVGVYNNVKTLKEAKEIGKSYGIPPNSMNYYCAAYRHMVNGTRHTGSIGTEIREYFLSQIFSKYDNQVKRNALIYGHKNEKCKKLCQGKRDDFQELAGRF